MTNEDDQRYGSNPIYDVEFVEVAMGEPTIYTYTIDELDFDPDIYEISDDPTEEEVNEAIENILNLPENERNIELLEDLIERQRIYKVDISEAAMNNAVLMRQLSEKTSLTVYQENKLPTIPDSPEGIVQFSIYARHALNAFKELLNNQKISSDVYKVKLEYALDFADVLLDADLELKDHLLGIEKGQGARTDLSQSKKKKLKKDVLEEWGLSRDTANKIERLTLEAVEQAKKYARNKKEPATRTLAFSFVRKNKFDANNGECESLDNAVYEDKHLTIDPNQEKINYTVLFACAGTGEAYLEENGFIGKVACELDKERARLYKDLYPNCEVVQGDIKTNMDKLIKLHKDNNCKMLLASPPCQDYTLLGKRDFTTDRAKLFIPLLEFIKATDPDWIVIENVQGFLTAKPEELETLLGGYTIGDYIVKELENLGHTVNVTVQNGVDYGTAQSRERAIFLASKKGLWKFPKKDDYRKMLWEAIGDLPSIEAGETGKDKDGNPIKYHTALPVEEYDIKAIKHTPTGQSAHKNKEEWKPKEKNGGPSTQTTPTSYKRLEWGKPVNTITTECGSVRGLNTCHPGRPKSDRTYSDARVLTLLELLRLVGLPDDYPFPEWIFKDKQGQYSEEIARDIIGECFLPRHVERLMTTIPR